MIRHIYTLIVDCPDRNAVVSTAVGQLATELLEGTEGTIAVDVGVIVPHDGGHGLRPRVWLEEVNHVDHQP